MLCYGQESTNAHWKSSSLQRGLQPVTKSIDAAAPEGTLIIRRNKPPTAAQAVSGEEEDIYGRNLNMKTLSSFADTENSPVMSLAGHAEASQPVVAPGAPGPHQSCHRDPRVIDLSEQSVNSMTSSATPTPSIASSPRQGSPVAQIQCQSQFNTLPVKTCSSQLFEANLPLARLPPGGEVGTSPNNMNHNTLPARMTDHHQGGFAPHATNRIPLPSGRHFKPFDHRRLNPMTEIQESPAAAAAATEAVARVPAGPRPLSVVASTSHGGSIASKSPQLPHMPTKLLHTNYSSTS